MAPTPSRTTQSAPVIPPAGVTQQVSYSGTPRLPNGWTWPDEYLRELADPQRRMRVFEEMGASDDAVRTGIEARRKEIGSANWVLSSEDTSDTGREILEFCEDNLYPQLDRLLRILAGGAMQYGFGAVEPVYSWSDQPVAKSIAREKVRRPTRKLKKGQRRIYLTKLAHMRPRSICTFQTSLQGDLQNAVQWVFDGVSYSQRPVPASKVLLWTYNMQGDDRWGVPPTRHCYKAWSFKYQLERLNIIGQERYGTGTPVAVAGEGWQQKEYDDLRKFLQEYVDGKMPYLVTPPGASLTIMEQRGTIQQAALAWVQMYNLAIAKTFLTQQTELGATSAGARSLGETFYEQMEGITQSDCEELANLINNELIMNLVQWNFGPQDDYPMFAPSQRVRVGSGVASVLQQLIAVGAIHPRPEDELFFRDAFGLPSVDIKTLETEWADRKSQAPPPSTDPEKGGGANEDVGEPEDGTVLTPKRRLRDRVLGARLRQATRALSLTADDDATMTYTPAVPGESSYRTPAFSAWEHTVVRPDILNRDLDLQTTRLAGEVHDALQAIDAQLAGQAAAAAVQGRATLVAAVKTVAVPARLKTKLQGVLEEAADRAKDYGSQAVYNEIERQLAGDPVGPNRAPKFGARAMRSMRVALLRLVTALTATDEPPVSDAETLSEQQIAAEVLSAVENEIDRREKATRGAIATALASTTDDADLPAIVTAAAKQALLELSPAVSQSQVQGVVNVGFQGGRASAAGAIQNGSGGADGGPLIGPDGTPVGIRSQVYSAAMDLDTCDECAQWDGAEFPMSGPKPQIRAPNPRCAGGFPKCRCIWTYIATDEDVPSRLAANGPLPLERAA